VVQKYNLYKMHIAESRTELPGATTTYMHVNLTYGWWILRQHTLKCRLQTVAVVRICSRFFPLQVMKNKGHTLPQRKFLGTHFWYRVSAADCGQNK
jgi:hypothetical protein